MDNWKGSWQLSRPAASWALTVKSSTTGATVRTLTGGEQRGRIDVTWDGTYASGAYVPSGAYSWTLSATPADGLGASVSATGRVTVTGGSAARRDHVGMEGVADALTLNSSGSLTFHRGGTGKYSTTGKVSGSGWSAATVAIPFGDLNGDRCNDVLVRMPDGRMRAYTPACGAALQPTTQHKVLGTGWNMHNVLTAAGDLTGDGRPDLVARKAATGELFVYRGTASGTVGSPIRVGSGWGVYTHITGAGDLNGDGRADLLARHTDGSLYRYDGLGNGLFAPRAKVFSNWGGSYNALIGAGDITGDGKADLVVRDKAGILYRNTGDGKGSFSGRTQIATGWGVYKGVF
ncbi:FG-GAP-like repeat-containing protein [Streptomyces sp. N35]|uniref:FG-GAP-like repeat-containing protein n=1 Tax=Streptomyces sp. N35 TaxID=2795730 RepID=UPI0018F63058|nr:FG-GAP-like repeat-containing protein [Streptomyces sp. N35]